MSNPAADIFRRAADLNAEDSRRRGNIVHLHSGSEVVATGDLHGNRAGLAKIIEYCHLSSAHQRQLVLQEIIHGLPDPRCGHDRSGELLLRAARLKTAHPDDVLFLLGNHDVAQLTGNEVIKDGRGLCKDFEAGVRFSFGEAADEVLEAMNDFLMSMPLAVQCPNGVFLAHSAPSPWRMEKAGIEIFQRPYRPEDLLRGGAVYEWTWGRDQSIEQLDALAEQLGVELFVLGHRHCKGGYEVLCERAIVLNSDDTHGCVMPFDADSPTSIEQLTTLVKPIAAL